MTLGITTIVVLKWSKNWNPEMEIRAEVIF